MIQHMDSGNLCSEATSSRRKMPVKLEIDDQLEEHHSPLLKRFKSSSASQQQWNASNDTSFSSHSQESILDEPSPLGLRLRKSPSLLDLIQMKLSQGTAFVANTKDDNLNSGVKRDSQGAAASGSVEKLKASNFPATLLRIGSWEYNSKYEGDLVAKCYFAKHKLVWEVLEGELKSKIEIQWSDIVALRANCPDNAPSSLTVVLGKQPLFFRETNPQPRKHTLWQATADFTNGQASKYRQHFLQCPQGLLTKHFEKLVQCDKRLYNLSQQPEIILDSPHFDTRSAALKNPNILKDHGLHQLIGKGSATSSFQDMGSPHSSMSPSFEIEHSPGISLDSLPREVPSPSSVMDCRSNEGNSNSDTASKGPKNWDQIKLPGLRPSMSVSDFIGHIEHCLSEEMTMGNPSFSAGRLEYQEMLEDIAQQLLNDNQVTAASDEKSLMSRVNSLCCLLQKDPTAVPSSYDDASSAEVPADGKHIQPGHDLQFMQDNKINLQFMQDNKIKAAEENSGDVSGGKQAPGMSRKDSLGDLLLQLPRIASLPKFLFNISEEGFNI